MVIKKVFLIIAIAFLVLPFGCARVKEKVEAMKPEIRSITLDWGEVTPETTEVLATIKAYNPNPFSLPIKKVACAINMAGVDLATAETVNLKIEKGAEFPINISAKIDNSKIPDFWYHHLKNNEKSKALIDLRTTFDLLVVDFTFPYKFEIPVETDLLGEIGKLAPIPIDEKIKMPITGQEKTVFKITIESLSGKWGEVTPQTTELILFATIYNQNPYPLSASKIAYDLRMNEIPLASGETGANYFFGPNSRSDITTKVVFDTMLMDKWFVSHIRQGERSTFHIDVALAFELPAELAQLLGREKLTLNVWSADKEFETHIMPQSIKF